MFLAERLKMCALVGFDWSVHPYTKNGLERFMEYIRIVQSETKGLGLNNHWQPQWMVIRPEFCRPDILGRAESPDRFARELIDVLGGYPGLGPVYRNQSETGAGKPPGYFGDSSVRRMIADIYEGDFQSFGYDL